MVLILWVILSMGLESAAVAVTIFFLDWVTGVWVMILTHSFNVEGLLPLTYRRLICLILVLPQPCSDVKRNLKISTQSYTFLRTKNCFLKVNFTPRNLCLHSWQRLCRVTLICSLQWCQLLGSCSLSSWSTQHQFFSRWQLSCVVFGIIFIFSRARRKPARQFIIFL